MVEVILLQIPPPIREALWVCAAIHCDHIMYVEHVLLHHLILLLLDLIQGPYHDIIIALVTKCLLHVHQQVPHRDILAFIQRAGPFVGVPMETGKDVGHMLASSYCLRKVSTSNCQSVYVTSAPGSVNLKISISNLAGTSHFFSLCSPFIYAGGLWSHSQWSTHWSLVPLCLGRKEASLLHPPQCTGT